MEEPPTRPTDDATHAPDRVAANQHLRQLATAELGEIRSVLTATGKDLESAREQCRALVGDLEATQRELSKREEDLDDTRTALQSTRDELAEASANANRAARENAVTAQALQDHIERLKTQIRSPWRLLAKWLLRRGPYARTTRARSH